MDGRCGVSTSMAHISRNILFYGDNLTILRDYLDDESVDLVYLDPPFNSSRSYNVLFKDESGQEAKAQITANMQMPPTSITFKQAEKARSDQPKQKGLFENADDQ